METGSKTRQNCLVLSPISFTPPTRIRQDKTRWFCLVHVNDVKQAQQMQAVEMLNARTIKAKIRYTLQTCEYQMLVL